MLNRRTKPTLTPAFPPRPDSFPRLPKPASDFEAMLADLRELETRVMERLDQIFEGVRKPEDSHPDDGQAIRLPEVLDILGGMSKSTLYGRLSASSKSYDPRAPQPFKLGNTQQSPSAWWRGEVIAYRQLLAKSRKSS